MELWDAYTEKEERTGQLLVRGEPIPQGVLHLVCEALVRHTDGSYLVMQRSFEKSTFPGCWEATAGGSALAGEDPEMCIRREVREETGICCDSFRLISKNIFSKGHCIFYSFLAITSCPKDSVVPQPGETVGYRWLSDDEFREFVKSDDMVSTQKRRNLGWLMENGYLPRGTTVPVTVAELTDSGICPTCYDRSHNFALYGDPADVTIFDNDRLTCVLIGAPRAPGHCAIVSAEHYKDMMDTPDALVSEMYVFAKKAMNALKQVYGAASVYLCTMCDGPMNHFHIQLIPRYPQEKRGSKNFVKPRQEYIHDPEKVAALRELLR